LQERLYANITAAPADTLYYKISSNPIAGNSYNVGSGMFYPTLTAAVNDINLNGISGDVTLLLTDANYSTAETFPITFESIEGNNGHTITLKPASGIDVLITQGAATSTIKLSGAKNSIIDGSNNGSDSRNLTIQNTNIASKDGATVWLTANGPTGANNNTVKNCNISGKIVTGGSPVQDVHGILIGGNSNLTGNNVFLVPYIGLTNNRTASSSNNRIQNNFISKVDYGITLMGVSALEQDNNNKIINNIVGGANKQDSVELGGIIALYQNNDSIYGNTVMNIAGIDGLQSTNGAYEMGIYLYESTNSIVANNQVSEMRGWSGTPRIVGIGTDAPFIYNS
jgi:hypothetical protein